MNNKLEKNTNVHLFVMTFDETIPFSP